LLTCTHDPRALHQRAWFIISIYFGKRGRKNQSSLKRPTHRLAPAANEEEFFELTEMSPEKNWQTRTRREDLAALKIPQTAKSTTGQFKKMPSRHTESLS